MNCIYIHLPINQKSYIFVKILLKEYRDMNSINQPLSNVQLELLKTFSHNLSDNELKELKALLVDFFFKNSCFRSKQSLGKGWLG